MNIRCLYTGLFALAFSCASVLADYMNIAIDGDFSDWAGVSTLAVDGADNVGSIDLATLQVANDESFFYVRYTLQASFNPNSGGGTFVGIDEDDSVATGFDVFTAGLIGTEAAWQNDFPFEQAAGNFNTGNGLTGATYLATPFNTATTSVEVSIPRTATHTVGGGAIFPADGQTIAVIVYTSDGVGDLVLGDYTFSAVPEPGSALLFLLGAVSLAAIRRRR